MFSTTSLRTFILSIFSCIIFTISAEGQFKPEFWWAIDFNSIFDNREGDATYTSNQTIFQTQLAPEIGLTLNDGKHRVAAGAVWTQPIDGNWDNHSIRPTIYYRFTGKKWQFSMGMFPRHQLIRRLPNYIWSDSNYYTQHNIRGALIQYKNTGGFFEALIDWRSIPTASRREAFNIIAQGEWKHNNGLLVAGGLAMMNHLAKSKNAPDDQYVVDNFMANPWVGLELGQKINVLDSMAIRIGVLSDIARDRSHGSKFKFAAGAWVDIDAQWRWLELKNTLYCGQRLFPFINHYGEMLNQGEPMYASRYFDRATLSAYILRKSFMTLKASLDFNFAESCFQFYQRIQLNISF
ncbi:MAG: hypothetical protein K2M94_07670 [Paramuribaculum sp.]|nr:hypothetical protein [Paramuribaculum sp.]